MPFWSDAPKRSAETPRRLWRALVFAAQGELRPSLAWLLILGGTFFLSLAVLELVLILLGLRGVYILRYLLGPTALARIVEWTQ